VAGLELDSDRKGGGVVRRPQRNRCAVAWGTGSDLRAFWSHQADESEEGLGQRAKAEAEMHSRCSGTEAKLGDWLEAGGSKENGEYKGRIQDFLLTCLFYLLANWVLWKILVSLLRLFFILMRTRLRSDQHISSFFHFRHMCSSVHMWKTWNSRGESHVNSSYNQHHYQFCGSAARAVGRPEMCTRCWCPSSLPHLCAGFLTWFWSCCLHIFFFHLVF
jgi:hypothetical protein